MNEKKAEAAALNIAKSYQEKMVTVPVCQVGGTSGLVVMRDAVLEGIDFGRAQAIVEREMAEAKLKSAGSQYVLVPREATKLMALAGESAASYGIGKPNDDEAIRRVWRDMIAAALPVSASEQEAVMEAQTGSMRHDVEEGVVVTCGKCHGIGCDFCDGFGYFNRHARPQHGGGAE